MGFVPLNLQYHSGRGRGVSTGKGDWESCKRPQIVRHGSNGTGKPNGSTRFGRKCFERSLDERAYFSYCEV
jgi:hypothetical protein